MFDQMYPLGMYQGMAPFIAIIAIWALVWKGMALWVIARRGQIGWFVFFLVVNTAGIGEIIYLLVTDGFKELKDSKK